VAECSIYLTPCACVVYQLSRCLVEQETQTSPLWVPQQGLVFIRSHDVIYGGPGLILFMCRLDLWGSAEGVTDTTQYAIVWGWNVEPRWWRAQIRLPAAFAEVWCVLILFVVADWHIRDSGGLVINHDPQFFTFIVKAASVVFHGRVWCYVISGELVYSA